MQTIQHHLATGQARTLTTGGITLSIKVLQGTLWLTQSGDDRDHFLGVGQGMTLGAARVVVQAEGDCAAIFDVLEAHALQALSPAPARNRITVDGLSSPRP